MSKQRILVTAAALAALLPTAACGAVSSGAQEYPSDTVKIVVPFDAGGSTDLITRALAPELEKALGGATVVVVNRPGASTAVGASEVANSKPDGHNLFVATTTTFVTTPLVQEVPYSISDFEGVHGMVNQPYMVVAAPDGPLQSLKDVANADKRLTYAVTTTGNNTHLALGQFLNRAGVEGQAVPFESAQEALTAAAGGQVDLAAVDLSIAAPQVKGGNISALGVTSAEPVEQFPDVPTLMSTGLNSEPFVGRWALVGPDGMPEGVTDTLVPATRQALNSKSFTEFRQQSFLSEPQYPDGQAWFEQMVPKQRKITEQLYAKLNVQPG